MTKLTYCSKTWTDINIDFETRTLKHCCKARTYEFPEVLTRDFISNSDRLQERKQYTIKNLAHKDCDSCWQDYDKGNTAYRDWANRWTDSYFEQHKNNLGADQHINYVEIKTDRTCDMSCIYCSSWSSSKVAQEQNEPYVDLTKEHDYTVFKEWINDYVHRDDLAADQIVFIFLGGEPTASERFYELVDYIETVTVDVDKKIRLEICTNANSKPYLMNKVIERINRSRLVWGIGISNESYGRTAELIRHGLSWERFGNNFRQYIENPNTELIVMSPTSSVFSLKTFAEYIDWVGEQFRLYAPNKNYTWYGNFTSWPDEMDIAHLPKAYVKYIDEARLALQRQQSNANYLYQDSFVGYLDLMAERIGTDYRENYKDIALDFLHKKQQYKKTAELTELMTNLDL